MLIRLLHRSPEAGPDVPTSVVVGSEGSQEILETLYRPPVGRWLRLNLIAAVSGDAAGVDGTSDSLSNAADRAILAALRNVADAVLVGARSVRAEGYRVPARATLVVVTSSGDLSGHRMDPERASRVLVLCPASAVGRVAETLGAAVAGAARVVVVPDSGGRLDPRAIVSTLRDLGLDSIVCEGGPSVAGQLLHDGLVDELCLSTSPVVIGSGLPVFGTERFDASRLTLSQLLIDDGSALYARWAVGR
ncbi:dihydrofolate reductase family protein [Frondihabitans cladoniiphilus]|uniref:Pyrimidine reductase family protein n=1 Tax=Frondihabitans cladoniiphilus TaxID=715785 RepID=A0ABP8VPD2_9MICO